MDVSLPSVARLCYREYHVVGIGELSPVFKTRREAEVWLGQYLVKLPNAKRPKLRDCLLCNARFLSAGFHDRLCARCGAVSNALGDEVRPSLPKSKRA